MYPYRILIVDDEKAQREMLVGFLAKKGLKVTDAENAQDALAMLERVNFEIALLDLRLPDSDGISLLKELKKAIPDMSAIMITAHGDVSSAVEAMKAGAVDYLNKPIDLDELLTIISKAGERFRILSENRGLRKLIEGQSTSAQFIGASDAVKELLATAYRVASTDSTVLITGESGTGKELVAGILHRASERRDKPFIPVACGALPETLLESELFGHEKGAFTGAERLRIGRFELSSGGTLFLDEIGEISTTVQAKLLRALEEGKIMRLGGEDPVEIDVRLISATNRNLPDEIKAGNFRQDLYYRLNVIELNIPPLRERREDIPVLAEHFIKMYSTRHKKRISGLTPEALDLLKGYPWYGNVRELENTLERAVVLCRADVIDTDDLPPVLKDTAEKSAPLPGNIKTIKDAEQYLIKRALDKHDGNITGAANELGLHRNTLSAKIKEYNLGR
ncbi:MAG: response regulator [candidate division Zixibacteria bacterium]|nr:response regulator [candidate division Zixibacteria bacterium]